MKTCTKCKVDKPLSQFVKDARRLHGVATYCKACSFALIKDWRQRNPDKCKASAKRYAAKNPGRHYKTKFGITNNDKLELFRQQGCKCAACGTSKHEHPRHSTDSGWVVDHDHATGRIRGIICWRCNLALGYARDSVSNLRGMADYLENNATLNNATLNSALNETSNGLN